MPEESSAAVRIASRRAALRASRPALVPCDRAARDGRAATPDSQLLRGDSRLTADARDEGCEGQPRGLRVVRAFDLAPKPFDEVSATENPCIPGDGFLRPAQGR
jgi:hypothetical protein